MSANLSDKKPAKRRYDWPGGLLYALGVSVWVVAGFFLAQQLVVSLLGVLVNLGMPLGTSNQAVLNAVAAAIIYTLSAVVIIGVPWWWRRYKTTPQELGLARLPSWTDILLGPAGVVIYLPLTVALVALASHVIGFDIGQKQEVGFSQLSNHTELILAFVTLVVIAPVLEEILFRGYLFGKIRARLPFWATALIVSLLFGIVHLQWNVGVDVFALSLTLCLLREVSGSIWAGVLLHMLKNSVAFYFLFINPIS